MFLCGSCDKKDHMQEVSTHISPILDSISLDYTQYVNYLFVNYTRENVVYYITHFSPDTSLHYYSVPVYCNAITGRVEEVPEPRWHVPESSEYIPTPREVAMQVSKYDFKISFNNKGRYYLLTHYADDIPAEEMRVTERWSIKEIEPPSYR